MAAGNNTPRIVAAIIGLVFFALIAAFVTMAMITRDEARLNVIGPIPASPGLERGGVRFAGTVHVWQVDGRLASDASGNLRIAIDLLGPNGQPPPPSLPMALALDMPEREMAPLRPRVQVGTLGAYTANVELPTTGQWRLRLEVPEITGVLLFTVDP